MATLALAAAGAAIGNALLPAGISLLGATVAGATLGAQAGALAGSYIDQALFASSGQARTVAGPRLHDLRVTSSTEGSPIPRVYGRARLAGQVIWATSFEEEVVTTTEGGSGKGTSRQPKVTTVDYRYYANFAVALAEGPISGIGRVWADGRELSLAEFQHRLYRGEESQPPDSLILAKEGSDSVPAYRGVAYVVFERMSLARFGNRLPQLSFEVFRAVDGFDASIRAVALIPGTGEFAYATGEVTRDIGAGIARSENVHMRQGGSDLEISLDQLQALHASVAAVSLVVSWFGTDLRAGHCQLRPGVEIADKATSPQLWHVAGAVRGTAHVVSTIEGRPAYGGTPSDRSVVSAIRELRARGLAVTFSPFVLMDIAADNALTDPYTGASGQPAYPWRGRITVDPAPGRPATPDKTAAAADQIAAIVGTAAPAQFAIAGDDVVYSGPAEWSFRRMVLHYAHLCKAAGGVDAFVLCSELRGLTQVRSGAASYPFVSALITLAAEVKAILGPATKITYAADWSEYFGHQPQDGSGDVIFHLDPLWAAAHVDAVGVDLYWPLADWRDGDAHLDRAAGAPSIYDLGYLKSNIFGGEGFDWYYASAADRAAQVRTPVTDDLGKPWVFRFKDLRGWWGSAHFDRPGGSESATPTAWVPQGKPVWLMEVGCPAVDKGANQPNVFLDPKSAESALPHFSSGARDDFMQRRYLQALQEYFDPAHPGYGTGANPVSGVYGGRMLDLTRMHVYAWDARPYPAFPADTATWGDGANWRTGHWLNGRSAAAPLPETVAAVLDDYGFAAHDTARLEGVVGGIVIDRIMSAREALQPLGLAGFFDAVESDGRIRFTPRAAARPVLDFAGDDLVEEKAGADLFTITRGQETELPAAAKIAYFAAEQDYRQAVGEARRQAGSSARVAQAELAVVLDAPSAQAIAETWLHEAWTARERAALTLPPSRLALEPGDVVSLAAGGRVRALRITEIGDSGARAAVALSFDAGIYDGPDGSPRAPALPRVDGGAQPLVAFLDLPLLSDTDTPADGRLAAWRSPWPGSVLAYRSPEATGFQLHASALAPAIMGETVAAFDTGPIGRYDRANRLRVRLHHGALTSASDLALFSGANLAAVANEDGEWELVQFRSVELIGAATYELAVLLRGQAGSEAAMRAPLPTGAPFVLIDNAVATVPVASAEIGLPFQWRIGPGNRDLGHGSYRVLQHAFRGVGHRPLSPVHVRGVRGGGDLTLSWVRRSRIGGDGWEQVEVPLGEEREQYEVDVLSAPGGGVLRTIATTIPGATYTAAQQAADFGSVPPSVALRVYQLGASYGRGTARETVV